jgi:hypothetical protein
MYKVYVEHSGNLNAPLARKASKELSGTLKKPINTQGSIANLHA